MWWMVNTASQLLYPLCRRLGGPQGQSGWVQKIPPPPGFDPRTIQPVVSPCTNWAILAHGRQRGLNSFTQNVNLAFLIKGFMQEEGKGEGIRKNLAGVEPRIFSIRSNLISYFWALYVKTEWHHYAGFLYFVCAVKDAFRFVLSLW